MSDARSLPEPPTFADAGNSSAGGLRGLSTAHNCTLRHYRGGDSAYLKPPGGKGPRLGGGLRGRVTEFSRGSRRRMQQLLASIDKTSLQIPLFITLTYPDRFPEDPKTWKRNLRTFRERFNRRWGKVGSIWRVELKDRKSGSRAGKIAPHFHVLAFLDVEPAEMASWLSTAWYESCGTLDPKHLQAGTRVERVDTWRGVRSYLSKYMAKTETLQPGRPIGRLWGVWYKDLLPISEEVVPISLRDFFKLRRIMRRFSGIRSTHHLRGFGCYMGYGTTRRLLAAYGYYRT